MQINKYLPVAFIYFFFNSLGLPFGLTFTALLTPALYIWVVIQRRQEILWPFLLAIVPFILIHIAQDVDVKTYLISWFNLATVYIFCQAFYTFLLKSNDTEGIFKTLLVANFIFCVLAIPLYFTDWYHLVWAQQLLTEGIQNFRRLNLFTYEPSYYALLFTPLFCFFLLQIVFRQNTINTWWLLCMLLLPYILSFALGVIAALLLAGLFTHIVHICVLSRKRRVWQLLGMAGAAGVFLLVAVAAFWPDNVLFVRIENIYLGRDTSAKGRTFEAFWLAGQLLEMKSYWWGIGVGQIKVIGFELIRSFYYYDLDTTTVAIPNAAAETLAIFGWAGLTIRIAVELLLFMVTRVWSNYYRLLLFTFIFIYQFTGSFITNVAEYVIWILAFTNIFTQFNRRENL